MNQRTFARRRSARAHRTLRAAGWLASSLLAITAALGPSVGSVAAASVEPVAINSGNPTCDDFAGDVASWSEIKLQDSQLANGTYTDGVITITITNFVGSSSGTPGSFDWSSDLGVDAVFVKAGSSKHQLYVYDPEATSDTGLRPQAGKGNGISHLSICYDVDPIGGPIEEPTENPTEDPSEQPTEDPSEQPSEDPTEQPSEDPSEDPSEQPSEDPSEQPSEDPSEQPSESLRRPLGAAVRGPARAAVRRPLGAAVRGPERAAKRRPVGAAVGRSHRAAQRGSLGAAVRGSQRAAKRRPVGAAVGRSDRGAQRGPVGAAQRGSEPQPH